MSSAEQKIVQYLNEARAGEVALVSVLRSQIAMAPAGSHREGLEQHLEETRDHADRIQARLGELGDGASPLQAVIGFTETMIGQALALAKAPLDLVRGSGENERALKNAKDACATEALEIATYAALEQLADRVGDTRTATLAATIRADEERMLQRLIGEIPTLTDAVVGANVGSSGSPDRTRSRTRTRPPSARRAGDAKQTPKKTRTRASSSPRQPSQSPRRTPERRATAPATEPGGAAELRNEEPWPGYDELTSAEIEAVLMEGDEQLARKVAAYERVHRARADVMQRALIPVPNLS